MYRIFLLLLFISASPFLPESRAVERQQVHESEHWRVLVDLRPKVPGHLLIVPKRQLRDRSCLTRSEHNDLYDVEQLVHLALQHKMGAGTDNIQLEKNGEKGMPSSPGHFHIHVYPMTKADPTAEDMLRVGKKFFTRHKVDLPDAVLAEEVALYTMAFAIAQAIYYE